MYLFLCSTVLAFGFYRFGIRPLKASLVLNRHSSVFFHNTLKRMLVFACKVHNLRHFCFSNFIGKHTAFAHTGIMYMQHHLRCLLFVFLKKPFKHMDYKFHGRIVVIEQQNTIKARLFDFCARARDDTSVGALVIIASIVVIVRQINFHAFNMTLLACWFKIKSR